MAIACDNEAVIPPDVTPEPEAMGSDVERMRHGFRMWNPIASGSRRWNPLPRQAGYERRRSLAMWVIWISSVPP